MIERSYYFRFALEPQKALGIPRHGSGQDFDGHLAIELGVSLARYTSPIPPAPIGARTS
jgi:hypothetical protein